MAKADNSIYISLDKAAQEQFQHILESNTRNANIISGLEFCGLQRIALHGHRDDTVIDYMWTIS